MLDQLGDAEERVSAAGVINPIPIAIAGIAVLLGLKLGQKGSAMALRVCLFAFVALVAWLRLFRGFDGIATRSAMLGGFFALGFLMAGLAFVGPMLFQRWIYAAAVSVALTLVFSLAINAYSTAATCILYGRC